MIVVLGRPVLAPAPAAPRPRPRGRDRAAGPPRAGRAAGPDRGSGPHREDRAAGLAAAIALAAVAAGARVELVGSVGDDEAGDRLAVALGRAGIGHAALLRIAGSATPTAADPSQPRPRLDAADVELGLGYLPGYRVLVVAEPLEKDIAAAAMEAAAYHDAAVVALLAEAGASDDLRAEGATMLTVPPDAEGAFSQLVGRYAAALDAGEKPGPSFQAAAAAVGWESAGPRRTRERQG